ncbi:unnamed protein product [Didymodactylos carnosus]|uniref:Uncharacterized protein n=1 Tax=Didymodactylos carnosus TaxID=1234261 RepID=A0A814ZFR9_9BILA|nr:unnamed protein product [Didymodactylos carnosus]CAF4005913.1 unnamed protein product [Didymodactylos carnosus]
MSRSWSWLTVHMKLIVPEQNGLSLLAPTSTVTSFTAANHEYPMLKNIAAETTDIVGATVSKQSSGLKRSAEENVVYLKHAAVILYVITLAFLPFRY